MMDKLVCVVCKVQRSEYRDVVLFGQCVAWRDVITVAR